jgi:hypothetical protein
MFVAGTTDKDTSLSNPSVNVTIPSTPSLPIPHSSTSLSPPSIQPIAEDKKKEEERKRREMQKKQQEDEEK